MILRSEMERQDIDIYVLGPDIASPGRTVSSQIFERYPFVTTIGSVQLTMSDRIYPKSIYWKDRQHWNKNKMAQRVATLQRDVMSSI